MNEWKFEWMNGWIENWQLRGGWRRSFIIIVYEMKRCCWVDDHYAYSYFFFFFEIFLIFFFSSFFYFKLFLDIYLLFFLVQLKRWTCKKNKSKIDSFDNCMVEISSQMATSVHYHTLIQTHSHINKLLNN